MARCASLRLVERPRRTSSVSRRAVLKARVQLCLEIATDPLERFESRLVVGRLGSFQSLANALEQRVVGSFFGTFHRIDYDRLEPEDVVFLAVDFFAVDFLAVDLFAVVFFRSDSNLAIRRSRRSRSLLLARPRF